jgi:hypothetical protein
MMKRFIGLMVVLAGFVVSASAQVTPDRLRLAGCEVRIKANKTVVVTCPLVYGGPTYSGTSSFQPVSVDLTLAAAAGGTTGKFLSPMMGNIFGHNLSKAGNYIGGGIFHYNVSGTNATTYPSGAVLGGIGDGTTTAKGAFVAYIDGDSALTTAGAAFKVMSNNSTGGSKFTYGLDLYDASHNGYNAVAYTTADARFSSGATLNYLSGTASLNFGATAAGTCDSLTITVTGAADGNPVSIGIPAALATADTYQSFHAFVSGADTVTVKRCNLTNATTALSDPAAATVRATVLKP